MRIGDVDRARGTVLIEQGKRGRDRVIPTGDRALAWVDRCLIDARPRLVSEPTLGVVFLTVADDDFTHDHLTERVGRYIRAATGKRGSCRPIWRYRS